MSSPGDDELIAQLRQQLGSATGRVQPGSADPADELSVPATRMERAISPAATAIADQIMGHDALVAVETSVALRSVDGSTTKVSTECTIGRQVGEGRLTIADGRVSRSHAVVVNNAGTLAVRDLDSSNGTFLVREGVSHDVGSDPVELRPGDRLETIGGVVLADVIEVAP